MAQANPEGFQYKFVDNFMQGMRKDMRSDAMPDEAGIYMQNVTLRDGVMAVDKGYTQFMSNVDGTPQLILNHDYPNNTGDLILVTSTTVYERLSGEWNFAVGVQPSGGGTANHDIPSTVTTAVAAAGQPNITVSSVTGFAAGKKIGVRYKTSAAIAITGTTKDTTTTYTVAGEQAINVGNTLLVQGYALSTYNVTQTVTSVTVAADLSATTIVTSLNSSGFANTNSTNPTLERSDPTKEFQTTIKSNWNGSNPIVLNENLPGRVLQGARVVRPPELNGLDTVIPDHVFVPSWTPEVNPGNSSPTDAIIAGASVVTNYNDTPLVIMKGTGGVTVRNFDFSNVRVSPYTNAQAAVTSFKAKTVELFNEKLCFGKTNENGSINGSRLRMSKAGSFEDFRSDSGGEVFDLLEGDSNIQAIKTLGKMLLVYKRRSIIRGDYIGSVDTSTRFQTTIANEGAISTHAVEKAPGIHYVVGTKNIYEYDGGPKLKNIGDAIREDLYTPTRFANINMKEFVHCSYDPEFQELTVYFPQGLIRGTRKAYIFSEKYQSWAHRIYTHYFTYASTFKSVETKTWNDLRQTWDTYPQPWNGAFFVSEKLHRFRLCQGKLVDQDGDVLDHNTLGIGNIVVDGNSIKKTELGYTIPWQFDTKDFYLPNNLIRVDFADVYASGDDVALWYSDDLGVIWRRVRATEARDELGADRIHLNKAAKRLRFRFKGNSTNFQLGWFGFNFIPEFSW